MEVTAIFLETKIFAVNVNKLTQDISFKVGHAVISQHVAILRLTFNLFSFFNQRQIVYIFCEIMVLILVN